MLFLLFRVGDDRYALETQAIAEIVPLARLRHIRQAPAGVAGLLDLRGTPVPVIDLSLLLLARPARSVMSTRIVLVHRNPGRHPEAPDGVADDRNLLGLVAENATEIIRRDPAEFVDIGVATADAAYFGPFARDAQGLVQWIVVDRLVTPGAGNHLLPLETEL